MVSDLWLSLFVGSFAVYRLARMLALEEGPFELFSKWRDWLFSKRGNDWVHEGFSCPLCISYWLGLAVALYMTTVFTMSLMGVLFAWHAIAGVSAFLYRMEAR